MLYVTEGGCWGQAGHGVTVATLSQGAGGQPAVQSQACRGKCVGGGVHNLSFAFLLLSVFWF